MEWMKAESYENGLVKIPDRWLHLHYYEALNILFRFENSLRIFVYIILKKHLGKDWDLAALGDGITIRTETKKRIQQSREHGYLGYEAKSPMLYLNSGELTQLITSDTYWKYFTSYFKASKQIILTKLQEIGTVRNSLAHFRPIKQDDIDLIKQNSKHVLLEVESCLIQVTSITNVVPTNTESQWYVDLKSIGNEFISTALFASSNQDWIRLDYCYQIPMLQKRGSRTYISAKVGTLRVREIISQHPAIKSSCIYACELPTYGSVTKEERITGRKIVSFVFSKPNLESQLQEITNELKVLALNIEQETILISQDHLAKGRFVEVKNVTASWAEYQNGSSYWKTSMAALKTPLEEIDNIEFWGERDHFQDDFISSTHLYPWMPSTVSNEEIPF